MINDDLHQLLYENLDWIDNECQTLLKELHIPWQFYEDLKQELTLTFLEKYDRFEGRNGSSYQHYLKLHFLGAANKFLFSNKFPVRIPKTSAGRMTDEELNDLKGPVDDFDVRSLLDETNEDDLWVAEYLQYLDKKEQKVLILLYGLNNKKPLLQTEIAEILEVSPTTVATLRDKALTKIKNRLKKEEE